MIISKTLLPAILAAFLCCAPLAGAQQRDGQNATPPDPEEMAVKEAERLERLLALEDWQTFYVDSILRHDYSAMQREALDLQKAKVEQSRIYLEVRDKWMERIDNSLQRYFTAEQWKKYLKDGAGKRQREREKRKKENQ